MKPVIVNSIFVVLLLAFLGPGTDHWNINGKTYGGLEDCTVGIAFPTYPCTGGPGCDDVQMVDYQSAPFGMPNTSKVVGEWDCPEVLCTGNFWNEVVLNGPEWCNIVWPGIE